MSFLLFYMWRKFSNNILINGTEAQKLYISESLEEFVVELKKTPIFKEYDDTNEFEDQIELSDPFNMLIKFSLSDIEEVRRMNEVLLKNI